MHLFIEFGLMYKEIEVDEYPITSNVEMFQGDICDAYGVKIVRKH